MPALKQLSVAKKLQIKSTQQKEWSYYGIVSSFMDDLYIKEGDYHALTFESTAMLSDFRQLLPSYFENKTQSECLYLKFLDDHGNVLRGKDFYFISLDCSIVNLKEERDTRIRYRNYYFTI